MTKEDKELLLQDLCARLPYGVICKTSKGNGYLCSINQTIFGIEYGINIKATERDYFNDKEEIIKPYLRPMSSMTAEELYEVQEILGKEAEIRDGFIHIIDSSINSFTYLELQAVFEWFNTYHFDYRGLIEKGLAIEAKEGMYDFKLLDYCLPSQNESDSF